MSLVRMAALQVCGTVPREPTRRLGGEIQAWGPKPALMSIRCKQVAVAEEPSESAGILIPAVDSSKTGRYS